MKVTKEGSSHRTYDPVHALKQLSSLLLPPNIHPRIDFYPLRELSQPLLNAFDLRGSDIGECRSRVSIKGGEGDVVEVDQADLLDASCSDW